MPECTLGQGLFPPQRMPDYYVTLIDGHDVVLPEWALTEARRVYGERAHRVAVTLPW